MRSKNICYKRCINVANLPWYLGVSHANRNVHAAIPRGVLTLVPVFIVSLPTVMSQSLIVLVETSRSLMVIA